MERFVRKFMNEANETVKHVRTGHLTRKDFIKLGVLVLAGGSLACGLNIAVQSPDASINPAATPTRFPSNGDPTPGPDMLKYDPIILNQEKVLEVKVGQDKTVGDIFKLVQDDKQIKSLFTDPSSVEYSAMGISVGKKGQSDTVYPFISAVSAKENRGYTAIVMQIGDKVGPIFLDKIVDKDNKVGLGINSITASVYGLPGPIVYFSTNLTEAQISKMSDVSFRTLMLYLFRMDLRFRHNNSKVG